MASLPSPRFLCALAAFATAALNAHSAGPSVQIPNAAQPQLAATAEGHVWLAYGQANDVLVARSIDGGKTFAPAVTAASLPKIALGMRRGPRITAQGERVTVTVIAHELLSYHSSDGGRTWSEAVTINEVPTSAREGLHDLAGSPGGRAYVTWLDLRNGRTEMWGAESKDGGRTWGKNEQVYRSSDKTICECCHPTALYDAQGNLAVMWRNSINGSRDMWLTTRASGAKQFTPAKKLGEGTWKLEGCPMDGGTIVALGGGKFASVWQRAGEVIWAPADGPEILLGKGKQPVAVAGGGETRVYWQDGTDLVSRTLGPEKPARHAANARFAVILNIPGNRGTVLAYEQGSPKEKQPGVVIERL